MKNILILGIGGGGQNVLDRNSKKLDDYELLIAGTDEQLLANASTPTVLFPNRYVSEDSLGCGGHIGLGANIAQKHCSLLKDKLSGIEHVMIIACLGGGFSSGATPVITEYINKLGIKTDVIVTLPFGFEGKKRNINAGNCIENLRDITDNVTVISNDNLLETINRKCSVQDAFTIIDNVIISKVIEITGK